MTQSIRKRTFVAVSSVLIAILVDQLIKIAVKTGMYLGESYSVFGDWFKICFVENNGMAFGMELFNKLFLTGFRIVAVALLCYILYRIIRNSRYSMGFLLCVSLILALSVILSIACSMARFFRRAIAGWQNLSLGERGMENCCKVGW